MAGAPGLTTDGFEVTFGTNHLGHFLLTTLLIDELKKGAPSRVVTVSSDLHFKSPTIPFNTLRTPTPTSQKLILYRISKLANVLFTKELANRYKADNITAFSLHPGAVATDIWRYVPSWLAWIGKQFMKTEEQGAKCTLYCTLHPDLEELSGTYFDENSKPGKENPLANDKELAKKLWEESCKWCGLGEDSTDKRDEDDGLNQL